jgi:hypothetical protein
MPGIFSPLPPAFAQKIADIDTVLAIDPYLLAHQQHDHAANQKVFLEIIAMHLALDSDLATKNLKEISAQHDIRSFFALLTNLIDAAPRQAPELFIDQALFVLVTHKNPEVWLFFIRLLDDPHVNNDSVAYMRRALKLRVGEERKFFGINVAEYWVAQCIGAKLLRKYPRDEIIKLDEPLDSPSVKACIQLIPFGSQSAFSRVCNLYQLVIRKLSTPDEYAKHLVAYNAFYEDHHAEALFGHYAQLLRMYFLSEYFFSSIDTIEVGPSQEMLVYPVMCNVLLEIANLMDQNNKALAIAEQSGVYKFVRFSEHYKKMHEEKLPKIHEMAAVLKEGRELILAVQSNEAIKPWTRCTNS